MSSYLTSSEADTIVAGLPGFAGFKAANDATKTAALLLATDRFDTARRYQGRKYVMDGSQSLEFPRVAYESSGQSSPRPVVDGNGVAEVVWEWDSASNTAVVPLGVKWAVVFEAESIIRGDRDGRLAAMHDGVTSETVGSVSRSYGLGAGSNGAPVLCVEADRISQKYRFRTGRIT